MTSCPQCGSAKLVLRTPVVAGPIGWGARCKDCGHHWSFQDQDIPFRGLTVWQALDQWCREHDLESHHDMDDIDREEFELAYYGPREEQGNEIL